ncbi:MAG TPA: TRAP transporter substrate-binding protein [Candidatus Limnocylindria bacterium]|nr:TRAP transporter substrate-binding protein [Candidatus Limnocylindria bacterium]
MDRRSLLKYASVSGLASLATACLSQNAPPTTQATSSPGAGGSTTAPQQQTITWKMQSAFSPQDIFHEMLTDWAKKVNDMSAGRLKIDALPNNAVVPFTQIIDATSSGTLDGGLGVPAYWFGKHRALSLFGTGPAIGIDAETVLGWVYYGGGQAMYDELLQKTLNLNVQSLFFGPMPTQPLGWFKENPITDASQLRGLRYRTVGLSADLFTELGAAVQTLAGGDIVPALQTGRIDAAEFNNPTSDKLLGFQDVAKVLMVQSYHQPAEFLEVLINKGKFDALPADLKAIVRGATMAQSADFTWKFMDRNSKDYAEFKQKGVRVVVTPQSVLQAQLNAWKTIIEREIAKPDTGPAFKRIYDSQREWAQRVGTLRAEVNVSTTLATNFFFPR